jgi:hypothetical protein
VKSGLEMGQVCIYRRSINCLSLYADRGHHKLKNMDQKDINKAIEVVGSEEKLNKMVLQVAKMNKKLPGIEWSFC